MAFAAAGAEAAMGGEAAGAKLGGGAGGPNLSKPMEGIQNFSSPGGPEKKEEGNTPGAPSPMDAMKKLVPSSGSPKDDKDKSGGPSEDLATATIKALEALKDLGQRAPNAMGGLSGPVMGGDMKAKGAEDMKGPSPAGASPVPAAPGPQPKEPKKSTPFDMECTPGG